MVRIAVIASFFQMYCSKSRFDILLFPISNFFMLNRVYKKSLTFVILQFLLPFENIKQEAPL